VKKKNVPDMPGEIGESVRRVREVAKSNGSEIVL
jgi:hypothetical protein